MLIRNLDVTQGLCNGTRLQVMRTSENNLFCRILTGPRAGAQNIIAIPRIQFEYGRARHHRGLRFRRLQFPIRLCFAMTINKAQGQTLQRMALVLNGRQCFSHGQVYVAMSRVTQMDGIRVYAPFCQSGYETRIGAKAPYEAAKRPSECLKRRKISTVAKDHYEAAKRPSEYLKRRKIRKRVRGEEGRGERGGGKEEELAEGPHEAAKRPSVYLKHCDEGALRGREAAERVP
ncbi:hypothetical protein niasHT_005917 [Heterodera trifolii]|uniref:ATP-dependent DNA helicase n=1 Tax=Heterodera trifolii TaxID=157864 RepID=A0ABD2LX69_9BILA